MIYHSKAKITFVNNFIESPCNLSYPLGARPLIAKNIPKTSQRRILLYSIKEPLNKFGQTMAHVGFSDSNLNYLLTIGFKFELLASNHVLVAYGEILNSL